MLRVVSLRRGWRKSCAGTKVFQCQDGSIERSHKTLTGTQALLQMTNLPRQLFFFRGKLAIGLLLEPEMVKCNSHY
jgi:hypothetical protein